MSGLFGNDVSQSQEGGQGNFQIAHNTGTVSNGLTFEQHQFALREAIEQKTDDLERAHGAEKELILRQLTELQSRNVEIEKDYQERLAELAEVKTQLARFQNSIDQAKWDVAIAAIDRNDTSIAEELFNELLAAAEDRRKDAEKDEADLHFQLGKIAEGKVLWREAYGHYRQASKLTADYDHLRAHAHMAFQLREVNEALEVSELAARSAERDFGKESEEHTDALHRLAIALCDSGSFTEAEAVFNKVLRIRGGISSLVDGSGGFDVGYARTLSAFAFLLEQCGRYPEAEKIGRELLTIAQKITGFDSATLATWSNNLGQALLKQKKYQEAEDLFKEALNLTENGLGNNHPAYANYLNNLAALLLERKQFRKAENHTREAIEIIKNTLGEMNRMYATLLGTLASALQSQAKHHEAGAIFRKVMKIDEKAIGEEHPDYAIDQANLAMSLIYEGKNRDAKPFLEKALVTFRKVFPSKHKIIVAHEYFLNQVTQYPNKKLNSNDG